jgi:hypothetical protein
MARRVVQNAVSIVTQNAVSTVTQNAVSTVTQNAVSIVTQKFRLFYGRIQLSTRNADKVVLAACVVHSYLRDCVTV